MFTSRAEYRLLLREDNADLRLTEIGYKIGLATPDSYHRLVDKRHAISELVIFLERTQLTSTQELNGWMESFGSSPLRNQTSLAVLLRRPEISLDQLDKLVPGMPKFSAHVEAEAEIQIKYEGYVNRQSEMVRRFQKMEQLKLPNDMDYFKIQGLSREVREKLSRIQPRSLGQASRISGITPAAMSLLSVYLKRTNSQ